ncbi:sulfatase [Microbulbifer mangrovi]|uniref:sulfatase n=1 Tax=Microbulbifer mangrovi TaxID=927787 RepID=UPI00195B1F26|nr:sulfatase [Microbulbifer mangrovi]
MRIPRSAVRFVVCCIAALANPLVSAAEVSAESPADKPNILFISIDDLRPEIGPYGAEIAVTPNLDKLARDGVTFNKAYAQQAICGPSRASALTGMRPDTLGVTHNYVKFRDQKPDVVTLPQHFINNGYDATYVGKIFHHGDKDDDHSWNIKAATKLMPEGSKAPGHYAIAENSEVQHKNRQAMFEKYGEQAKFGLGRGPATEGADVPDNAYIDGYNTDLAIVTLKDLLKKSDKPIFFGFGMNKPHLPWIAPKKYWDLYDPKDIAMTTQTDAPENSAAMGLHASFELRTFFDIPKDTPISPEMALTLRHAYLACISYVDAQIGRMLDAMKAERVLDNTVVILWSDHGFHLGEMGIWGKATNYEIAARVPLIISTPATRANPQSAKTDALVELIDMYPTLSDLAGIPRPSHIEGRSLVPLLDNPDQDWWSTAAYSQFPNPALREWGAYPLRPGMRETYFKTLIVRVEEKIQQQQKSTWDRELFEQHLMGYSMRTQRYRMIAWMDTRDIDTAPLFVELYDHETDPKETRNVADNNESVVARLLKQMRADLNLTAMTAENTASTEEIAKR